MYRLHPLCRKRLEWLARCSYQSLLQHIGYTRVSGQRGGLRLGDDVQDTVSRDGCFGSASTIGHAEKLLGQVIKLFAEAEDVLNKYKSRTQPQDSSLAVYISKTDLDPVMAKLFKKMRQLAIKH